MLFACKLAPRSVKTFSLCVCVFNKWYYRIINRELSLLASAHLCTYTYIHTKPRDTVPTKLTWQGHHKPSKANSNALDAGSVRCWH